MRSAPVDSSSFLDMVWVMATTNMPALFPAQTPLPGLLDLIIDVTG